MADYESHFYKLTESELERAEFRERFFQKNPKAHISNYHQTINLDWSYQGM